MGLPAALPTFYTSETVSAGREPTCCDAVVLAPTGPPMRLHEAPALQEEVISMKDTHHGESMDLATAAGEG